VNIERLGKNGIDKTHSQGVGARFFDKLRSGLLRSLFPERLLDKSADSWTGVFR